MPLRSFFFQLSKWREHAFRWQAGGIFRDGSLKVRFRCCHSFGMPTASLTGGYNGGGGELESLVNRGNIPRNNI